MHGYSLSHLWHLVSYAEATMLMSFFFVCLFVFLLRSFLSKLTDSLYVQKSWGKKLCMCVCVSVYLILYFQQNVEYYIHCLWHMESMTNKTNKKS